MKKLFALILALCMVFALCASASADKTYELKLSTTQTDTSMIYAGMKAAADKIFEDTDGHVKVTIYPSSQLGAEEDMIDQALQGMNIAVLTDAGRLSSYVPDMGIMNMAYFVNNYDDGCKVMETETFKGWDEALAAEGLRGLCYNYYDGARSFCGHEAFVPRALLLTPSPLKLSAQPLITLVGAKFTTASRPRPLTAAKLSSPLSYPARSMKSASTAARPSTSTSSTWLYVARPGSSLSRKSIRKS